MKVYMKMKESIYSKEHVEIELTMIRDFWTDEPKPFVQNFRWNQNHRDGVAKPLQW